MSASNVAMAQVRTEYRAFWVNTFNTNLNNHNDVVTMINNAKAAKANAVFVQLRRRGDSWYLNSLEPPGDRVPIQAGLIRFRTLSTLLMPRRLRSMRLLS